MRHTESDIVASVANNGWSCVAVRKVKLKGITNESLEPPLVTNKIVDG